MYQYPYGDSQQLNLDWLMEQWQETKASIDGSLQGEIDRVEAAITDLLTARDQAVAAKTAAETAATSASGYAGTASGAASTATAQATAAAASAALAGSKASDAQTAETNAALQATAAANSAAAAAVSKTNAGNSETAAAASSSAAAGNALFAEGVAKGTQNGTPVASGSPYYENNAAYWAGEAQNYDNDAALAAYYSEAMAKGTMNGTPVTSDQPGYEDNAEYYKDQAAASAASADGTNAQKMIAAPEEATSTASAAHAAGTYFRYNSKLYKATQDIALGGTITPNTNCVEDTVCAELTAQSEQIENLAENVLAPYGSSVNSINVGSGINMNAGTTFSTPKMARTPALATTTRKAVTITNSDYLYRVSIYSGSSISSSTWLGEATNGWTNANIVTVLPTNIGCFAVSIKRVDGADIANTESSTIKSALTFYIAIDKTLEKSDVAADAKTTGDALKVLNTSVGSMLIEQTNKALTSSNITGSGSGRYEIDPTDGSQTESTTHYASTYMKIRLRQIVKNDTDLLVRVHVYSRHRTQNDFDYATCSDWLAKGEEYAIPFQYVVSEISAIRLEFKNKTETELTSDDVVAVISGILFYATPMLTERVLADTYVNSDTVSNFETFDDVIAAYDVLQNKNSGYMSKQTLTSGSFTNYAYTITLGGYNKYGGRANRDTEQTRKVILIVSGIHGEERSGVASVYSFINDLLVLAKLEPCLACTIKVIPVGCPSAFDADTRLSGNSVNINRNFASSNWTATSVGDDYAGASAGSEDETKVIQNWIDSNLTNGALYIDVHNAQRVLEISCLISSNITTPSTSYKQTYFNAINKVISYFKNWRGITASNTVYGYTCTSVNTGTSVSYAQEKGLAAYTLELSWNIEDTGKHSNFTIGTGAEVIGTLLRQFTNEHPFTPTYTT